MDEINDFFKSHASPKQLRGSQSGGYVMSSSYASSSNSRIPVRPRLGQEYAAQIQKKEKEAMLDNKFDNWCEEENDLDSETVHQTQIVFRKYTFRNNEADLPIEEYKSRIIGMIESQKVTIIEGPTGCGKSTQVPLWIMKECFNAQEHCNIIVSQPRRIAAMCIANRVASEVSCEVGTLVGYRVGLEKKISQDTRLQYVTTGVLLNEIVNAQSLKSYTHIILDEVHERDQEMDFLLIVIRKLMRAKHKNVRLILMSATFNVQAFSEYFATGVTGSLESIPVMTMPSITNFKVHTYYLGTLQKLRKVEVNKAKPEISDDMLALTVLLLNSIESIDEFEEKKLPEKDRRPCILIFLPGISDIENLYGLLSSEKKRLKIDSKSILHKWWLVPLHSTITVSEQNRAFSKPPQGCRKILLATNIAESSITVPDIKYVIDFCLTKINLIKPDSQFPMLQLCWASKSNCIQRAGRTGRVREGRVYRLVPEEMFDTFDEENTPEIQRSNIETLILSAKMLKMGSPKDILALAMDPPDLSNIRKNILQLKTLGALYKTVNRVYSDEDGDITYLGRIMSKLPVNIRVSKLIMLGYIFGCMEEAIIIGAAISTKNIFKAPFLNPLATYNSKLSWAQGSMSDCIAYLQVYTVYKSLGQIKNFGARSGGVNEWADKAFLQLKALKDWDKLVDDIKKRLQMEDIKIKEQKSKIWSRVELALILKIIMAGAFYPNYFIMSSNCSEDDRNAAKAINGWDPHNSVYFLNMNNHQPGELYISQLKHLLAKNGCTAKNVQFDFDKNSSKIIVSFPSTLVDESILLMSKVALPVYQLVRMRLSKIPIVLKVLPLQEALHRATELGIIGSVSSRKSKLSPVDKNLFINPRLPGIDESYVILKILKFELNGLFWAQYADESTLNELQQMSIDLNAPRAELAPLNELPVIGDLYAAVYNETTKRFHRVVVESFISNVNVMVAFIDLGKNKIVNIEKLRKPGPSLNHLKMIKPAAFQFVLTELTPSIIKDTRGSWSKEAFMRIKELTEGKRLNGKVYSVVFSLISLELYDGCVNINELLMREGFAQVSEESYLSKVNKDLRTRANNMQPVEINIHNDQQAKKNTHNVTEHLAPNERECTQSITLKGPFSPLETTVTSLFNIGINKAVDIDKNSVNCILMNTDNDTSSRLLVAACINESASGYRYTIRDTTLMPNLPGIASILALIFCPTAELRTDEHYSCIVSTLCGLGHEGGTPLFPEYDIVVDTDVEITNDDLRNINYLRRSISEAIMNMEVGYFDDNMQLQTSNNIKIVINSLLSIRRKQHNFMALRDIWRWNSLDHSRVLPVEDDTPKSNHILPPISEIKLVPRNKSLLKKLAEENKNLHDLCKINSLHDDNTQIKCNLCGTGKLTLSNLSIHLHSRMHIDQEVSLSMSLSS